MDKIATNNFIVELRTDVKAAKAMVAGNLVRKINELKKALEKDTDDLIKKEKAEKKIETLHADIKLLKTIDHYVICKNAILKPDPKHWNDLLCKSDAPEEMKLIARVVSKGRIQKKVAKFRSDHKDCDEWLEEYFEFREKKRELTEVKVAKRKTKPASQRNRRPRELTDKTNDLEADSNPEGAKKQFTKKWNKNPGKSHNRDVNKGPARSHDKRQLRNDNRAPHLAGNPNRDQSRNGNRDQGGRNNARNFNSSHSNDNAKPNQHESLHPSWASKRKEKEILKAALSGKAPEQPKRIILNSA